MNPPDPARLPLGRVLESVYRTHPHETVHYGAAPGQDAVTLCGAQTEASNFGMQDNWTPLATSRAVDCKACLTQVTWILGAVQSKAAASASPAPLPPPSHFPFPHATPGLWLLALGEPPAPRGPGHLEPDSRIPVIQAIRAMTGLGLWEAKTLVDTLPQYFGPIPLDHPEVQTLRSLGCRVEWRAVADVPPLRDARTPRRVS